MSTSDDQWQAFKRYQDQIRKEQAEKAQHISEEQERKKKESEHQQLLREQARREIEQHQAESRRLAEQQTQERLRHEEEVLNALLAESAEALRIANEKNREAQRKAQEIQQLRQARAKVSPIEESFDAAWRKAHPDVELQRQHPIGKYRVDFAYPEAMIAIELDGHEFHSTRRDRTKDYRRQRTIEGLGWFFVRFTGSEIFSDVESCVEIAWERIQARQ